MRRAFIAVGSNLNPERNILAALRRLAARARLEAVSTFYLAPALGRPEQPDFYNGALEIATDLPPRELKFTLLREIEGELGRRRSADKYAAREIDLDLALYDELAVNEPDLVLPDPEIAARAFLARPLAELAPDLIPPGSDRSLREIAAVLDASALRPLPGFTAHLRKELLHES
jgi:2-amino-4-hydroxy-6-hydroxymethyldihydropteridine diphosphokinase